jgi:hypothetical protein
MPMTAAVIRPKETAMLPKKVSNKDATMFTYTENMI